MAVGDRLKQIRLAKGYSLDDLVREIGGLVTKQSLSKYEKGLSVPSLSVMNVLAASLGVNVAYFYDAPSYKVQFHGFRKTSRLCKREQEKIQSLISQLLEDRIPLQVCSETDWRFHLPIQSLPAHAGQDIENAALKIREEWNLGRAPISSVVETLEENHVHVLELDEQGHFDGLSATVEKDNETISAAVVTRKMDCGERQRLTLLHELGHLVLQPAEDQKENEHAAYRFASAFLIPEDELKNCVGVRRRKLAMEELILVKKRFGISLQAILHRLKDLDIITERQYKGWCISINQLGWKKKEPAPLAKEDPQWLRRTVLKGYAEGWISQFKAEQMVGESMPSSDSATLQKRRDFMKLPLDTRREILEKQAHALATHYNEDRDWRDMDEIDFIEY